MKQIKLPDYSFKSGIGGSKSVFGSIKDFFKQPTTSYKAISSSFFKVPARYSFGLGSAKASMNYAYDSYGYRSVPKGSYYYPIIPKSSGYPIISSYPKYPKIASYPKTIKYTTTPKYPDVRMPKVNVYPSKVGSYPSPKITRTPHTIFSSNSNYPKIPSKYPPLMKPIVEPLTPRPIEFFGKTPKPPKIKEPNRMPKGGIEEIEKAMPSGTYNAYARRNNNSKWVKVTKKPLPYNSAFNFGLQVADNTVARSVKLKKAGKTFSGMDDPFVNSAKFRRRKSRSKVPGEETIFVEQSQFAIDTLGEKQGLKVAKYLKGGNNWAY